jgi:magnesium-protoporphyrin O-methyltransferase
MRACCIHNRDAGRFFGWFAKRYRKRFAREGLESSQKQLMKGLMSSGLNEATLLDIGCGTGYLHQRLLRLAPRRLSVSTCPQMLVEPGRKRASKASPSNRLSGGDFVELADVLARADIVILDKAICCYPDADALVQRSARLAGRVYAFTIPRDRWTVRLALFVGRAFWRSFAVASARMSTTRQQSTAR